MTPCVWHDSVNANLQFKLVQTRFPEYGEVGERSYTLCPMANGRDGCRSSTTYGVLSCTFSVCQSRTGQGWSTYHELTVHRQKSLHVEQFDISPVRSRPFTSQFDEGRQETLDFPMLSMKTVRMAKECILMYQTGYSEAIISGAVFALTYIVIIAVQTTVRTANSPYQSSLLAAPWH